jgi:hypothetical protein
VKTLWPSADDLVVDTPEIPAAPVVITPDRVYRPGERRGPQTTEFWLTLLTVGGSVAGFLSHVLPGPWAAMAVAVSTAAYNLSRGLAKG